MRKIILIITLSAFIGNLSAQDSGRFFDMWESNDYRKYAAAYIVAGIFATVPFTLNWYYPERNSNGLYISTAFDPKMAIVDHVPNMRFKTFYHYERFELGVAYEFAPDPFFYHGASLGLDYVVFDKRLSLIAGIETTRIWNGNPEFGEPFQSVGINTEIRYLTKGRFSFFLLGNIKTRNLSNKKTVPSGYGGVLFQIKKP